VGEVQNQGKEERVFTGVLLAQWTDCTEVRRVFDAAKLGAVVCWLAQLEGSFLEEALFNQVFYVSIRRNPTLSSLEYAEDSFSPLQATHQAARILLVDRTGDLP
jgi:hypothetical protein